MRYEIQPSALGWVNISDHSEDVVMKRQHTIH